MRKARHLAVSALDERKPPKGRLATSPVADVLMDLLGLKRFDAELLTASAVILTGASVTTETDRDGLVTLDHAKALQSMGSLMCDALMSEASSRRADYLSELRWEDDGGAARREHN